MATVSYLTIDGEIVSVTRGGVERDYLPDPLGSTVALLDNSQTKTDTWSYDAWGTATRLTGSNATPFKFVGTLGYYIDSASHLYVRARYYRPIQGRWMTVDPLWPGETAFSYANGNPTANVDPSGMWPFLFFGRCRRRGKPMESPILLWPQPCSNADLETCNRECTPDGEGEAITVNGQCLCYCIPVWFECGLADVLECIRLCKRGGLVFDRCMPLSVNESFDKFKHCKCKKP